MLSRKGELTTQQIVILVVLIASFIVLLFFLFRLDFGKKSDSEICHNSVVLRGNSLIKESIPLDCQTKYVCLTRDGSDCEGLSYAEKVRAKTKEEVYKFLAEDFADCWWMYGEGKVDYVENTNSKKLFCAKCSQIAFDDSLKKIDEFKDGKINLTDFYTYMSNTKMSSSQTYNEYLFGTNSLQEISNGADFGEVQIGEDYYVLTGMHSDLSSFGVALRWASVGALVGGIVVVSMATGGIGTATMAMVGAGELIGGTLGVAGKNLYVAHFQKGDSGSDFMSPTLIRANSKEFNELNCDYAVSKS